MKNDYSKWIPELIEIVKQASEVILDFYERSRQFTVQTKEDRTPLTQADIASHQAIVNKIQQLTPDIPILSEEAADIPFAKRQQWQQYWCIDPLDGTREFIRHSGEFCINIALIKAQRPVCGLIHVPVQNIGYYAAEDMGAFKYDQAGHAAPITTRTWSPNKTIVAASHGVKLEKTRQLLANLGEYEIIRAGSAIKFGWVAEGKADLYTRLGDTSEWDTAAGQCIVEQAGGAVVDLATRQPLLYNAKPSLINPHFAVVSNQEILTLLNNQ